MRVVGILPEEAQKLGMLNYRAAKNFLKGNTAGRMLDVDDEIYGTACSKDEAGARVKRHMIHY